MEINVFLGAPGSGKGTQAKRLSSQAGFKHFSTGDMLRAAIQKNTEVGKKAKSYIDKGDLVPDNVMIELIKSELAPLSSDSKVILDGFPRTLPQAKALDQDSLTKVRRALYFTVPEMKLVKRLTGRRICQKCGESFHTEFMPPKVDGICDKCGSKLIQRTDDSESVVERRLQIFREQNDQILDYYRQQTNLLELNADAEVEKVFSTLKKSLS